MFYAKNFIFDGIPSEFFNLYLGEFSGSGDSTTGTSSDVQLLTDKLFRKAVPLFFGAEQTPVLSFNLSFYSPTEIDADDFSRISAWLFGQMEYKVLRICQPDMQDVFFNCFLTAPQIIRTGNLISGGSFTVVCDAPWGYKDPKTKTYNYSDEVVVNTIDFYNESADNAYTYPTEMVVTANAFGGSITITNTDDANRQFILTVSPNEVVTFNNDLEFITSSLVTYPISNFNLHWFRLKRGYNHLTVYGNVKTLEFSYPIATKIS